MKVLELPPWEIDQMNAALREGHRFEINALGGRFTWDLPVPCGATITGARIVLDPDTT